MISGKIHAAIIVMFCAIILLVPISVAQAMPHSIVGYVKDSGGSAISGATVTILNERTDAAMTVTTNSLGQYQADLTSLSDGYQVGDVISVKAVSGDMEGSSSVTVTSNPIDQCDVMLSEKMAYPAFSVIACIVALGSVFFGLSVHRRK